MVDLADAAYLMTREKAEGRPVNTENNGRLSDL
jgi:hypothetical protein